MKQNNQSALESDATQKKKNLMNFELSVQKSHWLISIILPALSNSCNSTLPSTNNELLSRLSFWTNDERIDKLRRSFFT